MSISPCPARPAPPLPLADWFVVETGEAHDLAPFEPFHYRRTRRASRPATVVHVLRARVAAAPPHIPALDAPSSIIGVLAVSMPALNSAFRHAAWPGLFAPMTPDQRPDRAAGAAAVNRLLRTISRVIVDPRFRALGVASALVRAYLARPLTPCTEALSAMGRVTRFFEHAGMTRYDTRPSRADAHLLRTLADLRIPAYRLIDVPAALARASRRNTLAPLDRALRTWARASVATRDAADEPTDSLAALAAMRLCSRPVGYAHALPGFEPVPPAPAHEAHP